MHEEALASDDSLESLYVKTKAIIKKGSKSFSLGSLFFNRETRLGAYLLYSFCRYCDDQVDDVDHRDDLSLEEKIKLKREKVRELREKTLALYRGETASEIAFVSFGKLIEIYRIPSHYPLELIEGMAMDIEKIHYETLEDLELYCYRVASVVGLMMCHIMGVSDSKALQFASEMGMAMQMTNISRDFEEDARMGRLYVPRQWIKQAGLSDPESLVEVRNRVLAHRLMSRLVEEAALRYYSGRAGLSYLPLRASLAISIASFVYEAIGWLVVRRGEKAWDRRPVVSKLGKLVEIIRGFGVWLWHLPLRLIHPWKRKRSLPLYRFRSFR